MILFICAAMEGVCMNLTLLSFSGKYGLMQKERAHTTVMKHNIKSFTLLT